MTRTVKPSLTADVKAVMKVSEVAKKLPLERLIGVSARDSRNLWLLKSHNTFAGEASVFDLIARRSGFEGDEALRFARGVVSYRRLMLINPVATKQLDEASIAELFSAFGEGGAQ